MREALLFRAFEDEPVDHESKLGRKYREEGVGVHDVMPRLKVLRRVH
jgi:hypothetical protein